MGKGALGGRGKPRGTEKEREGSRGNEEGYEIIGKPHERKLVTGV